MAEPPTYGTESANTCTLAFGNDPNLLSVELTLVQVLSEMFFPVKVLDNFT